MKKDQIHLGISWMNNNFFILELKKRSFNSCIRLSYDPELCNMWFICIQFVWVIFLSFLFPCVPSLSLKYDFLKKGQDFLQAWRMCLMSQYWQH